MSDKDEKNIHVREGQKPRDPYGSPGRVPSSRDGWSFGFGGSGGGRGEGGRPGTLSGSKRRRLRLQDKLRREQEARQKAEAEQQARIDAAAQAEQAQRDAAARADVEAQARAQANAAAQAQAARALAHRQVVDSLVQNQPAAKAGLEQQHAAAKATLASRLQSEIQAGMPAASNSGQRLLNEILDRKAQVNYLISQKVGQREQKTQRAYSLVGIDPKQIGAEQYRAILLARSATAEQAHEVHQAWLSAYTNALDVEILAESESFLGEQSELLSKRYAEESWAQENSSDSIQALSAKHTADPSRLWQTVAGPNTSPQHLPTATDVAKAIAEKMFARQAAKVLGRALPQLALLYPTQLANGELPPSILATPAANVGVTNDVDLEFIASRKGTVEVTHRLQLDETSGDLKLTWAIPDGVSVGKQVPVRSFTYNPTNNTYEFIRDGETTPALVWTPATTPASSSTWTPSEAPALPADPGTVVSPVSNEWDDYPTFDLEDIKDLILTFPKDSGLDPVYIMFKNPRYLPGVVSGMGGFETPNWEAAASHGLGSPIPSTVADILRDKRYAEFRNLKKAIWREISKLPDAAKNISNENLELMRKGNSPIAPYREQLGKNIWYEIHHITPIWAGGAVYDIDNLAITTPANHKEIHSNLRKTVEQQ
jgi:hypothetical protein